MWMELLGNIAILLVMAVGSVIVYHILTDEDRPEVLAKLKEQGCLSESTDGTTN